jgi:conjugal transfer pilus assembly protein TraF
MFLAKPSGFPAAIAGCLLAGAISASVASANVGTQPKAESKTPAYAGHGAKFIREHEEGWFWYKDPVLIEEQVEEKKEEPKKEESPVVVMKVDPPPEVEPEESAAAPDEGPETFSVKWFQDNLQKHLEIAIDDPTPENVRNYYMIQRVMMDKAQRFTEVAQSVVQGDPILDETRRRPYEPATGVLMNLRANEVLQETFVDLQDKIGIAYFFSGDKETCPTCTIAGRNLANLRERLGIEIMAISIDGQEHPDGRLADQTVMDQGQAEMLGVKTGPSMFVMIPPDRWIPVSHAAATQVELMERVLRVAKDEGLITEERFKAAQGVQYTPSTLDVLDALREESPEGKITEDPLELIKELRRME